MQTATIVYYSDGYCNQWILRTALSELSAASNKLNFEMVVISVKQSERSHRLMYQNILSGIDQAHSDLIYLAEHDVLYTHSHFNDRPDGPELYYNTNLLTAIPAGFFNAGLNGYPSLHLSQLSGHKELLRAAISMKIAETNTVIAEPAGKTYNSQIPNIDIRHSKAFTGSRESINTFVNDRFWGPIESFRQRFKL